MERILSELFPNGRGAFHSQKHLPFGLNDFSNELLVELFSYLRSKSLGCCRLVNKRWNSIILTHSLVTFKSVCFEVFLTGVLFAKVPKFRILPIKYYNESKYESYRFDRLQDGLPRNLCFQKLTLYDRLHGITGELFQLAQFSCLRKVMLWDLSGHLESDIKELWGTLMRCQPLEEVSFSFCKDVPLSVLKTADRRALPRLKELFLGDIQLNIDDFVHFLINVTHNVNSLVIMWKLQKEIRKVIQCLLSYPRECEFYLRRTERHTRFLAYLDFPKYAVNTRKNEDHVVMSVFAGWTITVSLRTFMSQFENSHWSMGIQMEQAPAPAV
ncbi:hypothetical protein QR680_010399 [Steinernema hermaphroditum]|uniref:F-box domain-containing protein n=1 Tax=Steinernema hermaphroditum TaxID=289476 RepID=A0AA39INU2_9BILA|nr:hypothetical protein QR680_010399 [Steinernema hermaphroditum]